MRTIAALLLLAGGYASAEPPASAPVPKMLCQAAEEPKDLDPLPRGADACPDLAAAVKESYGKAVCTSAFAPYLEAFVEGDADLKGRLTADYAARCALKDAGCGAGEASTGSMLKKVWSAAPGSKVEAHPEAYLEPALEAYQKDRAAFAKSDDGPYHRAELACHSFARHFVRTGSPDLARYDGFQEASRRYLDASGKLDAGTLARLGAYRPALAQLRTDRSADVRRWQEELAPLAVSTLDPAIAKGLLEKEDAEKSALAARQAALDGIRGGDEAAAGAYLTQAFDDVGLTGATVRDVAFAPGSGGGGQVEATVEIDWSKISEDRKADLERRGIKPPEPGFKGRTLVRVQAGGESLEKGVRAMEASIEKGAPLATIGTVVNVMADGLHDVDWGSAAAGGAAGVAGVAGGGGLADKKAAACAELGFQYADALTKAMEGCNAKIEQLAALKEVPSALLMSAVLGTAADAAKVPPSVLSAARKIEDDCRASYGRIETQKRDALQSGGCR